MIRQVKWIKGNETTTTGEEGETGMMTGGGGIDGVVAQQGACADTGEALCLPTISMEDAAETETTVR